VQSGIAKIMNFGLSTLLEQITLASRGKGMATYRDPLVLAVKDFK